MNVKLLLSLRRKFVKCWIKVVLRFDFEYLFFMLRNLRINGLWIVFLGDRKLLGCVMVVFLSKDVLLCDSISCL